MSLQMSLLRQVLFVLILQIYIFLQNFYFKPLFEKGEGGKWLCAFHSSEVSGLVLILLSWKVYLVMLFFERLNETAAKIFFWVFGK
jgi:hypothetical protein